MKVVPQVESAVKPGTVQRKCGCADQSKCSCHEPEKEKGVIQRRAHGGASSTAAISPAVTRGIQQSSGGGHSLPSSVRSNMESGFGRDLSHVRVHSDSNAHRLADSLHAQAFTTSSNIYFAQNQYHPETRQGQHLLAHEITHVVQQGNSANGAIQPRLELGAVDTEAEREADRVADAIVSGAKASPVVASPSTVVRRTAATTKPLDKGGKAITLPKTEPLELPAQKCDSANDLTYLLGVYKNAATNRRLRTTHAGRASGLWNIWAEGRQGVPNIEDYQKRLHSKCSPDHMQELQVGGADNFNNMRLLSQDRNEQAGSQIAGQITTLYNKYNVDTNSWIEFTEVIAKPGTSATADPTCLTGEEPLKRPGGAVTIDKGLIELVFIAGGAPVRIGYESSTEVPRRHRFAIAGAELDRVSKQTDGTHIIHAQISPKIKKFPVQGKAAAFDFKTDGPQPTGKGAWPKLLLSNPGPLSLNFPKMSPATLTPFIENGQWLAKGELIPTLSVLNKAKVWVEVSDEKLMGGVKLDPAALKSALPVPGLVIDPVTLEIKLDDGDFSAAGGFDFKYGTLAHGSILATFSKTGDFSAAGTIDLAIPGIDKAQGKAWIEHGKFGAEIAVDTKQLTFPGVKQAHLKVKVSDTGELAGTGTIDLSIPGLDNASLTFRADSTGQFGIDGQAKGKIPGLKDVQVDIGYAPGMLIGKGHAGLIVPGLESASIDLVYANGLFSGGATLKYAKGKLQGSVHAAISPAHKLSGRGEVSYEIVPKLVVVAGIELREDGTAKIDAEVKLPDFNLFDVPEFDRKIFGFHPPEIPIFAIPLGFRDVGLVAKVGVELHAIAGLNGRIKDALVAVQFDPNKEEHALAFEASATLNVQAHGGLKLIVDGELGLDLLVVEAMGTLPISATAELVGEFNAPAYLKYKDAKFIAGTTATVTVGPLFIFEGKVGVKVYTDLYFTEIVYYTNSWNLFKATWKPDLQIGMVFPVSYTFGEGVDFDPGKIHFIYPDFNFSAMLGKLLPF